MSEGLSDYELKRLETIRQNALIMQSLGILDAVKDLQAAAPKPKPKIKKPKAPVVTSRRRSSGRLAGEAPMEFEEGDEEGEAVAYVYRDPNDVGTMTYAEIKNFCARIRESMLERLKDELSEEQYARLVRANDEWLGGWTEFTARFGGSGERPMSNENIKSCLKQVMKLVSGAGVDHKSKQTRFAAGKPITLGITAAEVLELRAAAQLWVPLRSAPADVVGMVVDGTVVPRKPSTTVIDSSNGWLTNHPVSYTHLTLPTICSV